MLSKKASKITILVLAALLLAVTTFSLAAEATTPTVKSYSPADGTIQTSNYANLSFEVTDPHGIANTYYYITIDGRPGYSLKFEYTSGYWEYVDGG